MLSTEAGYRIYLVPHWCRKINVCHLFIGTLELAF